MGFSGGIEAERWAVGSEKSKRDADKGSSRLRWSRRRSDFAGCESWGSCVAGGPGLAFDFGHNIDGTRASAVQRVPSANISPRPPPAASDAALLMVPDLSHRL